MRNPRLFLVVALVVASACGDKAPGGDTDGGGGLTPADGSSPGTDGGGGSGCTDRCASGARACDGAGFKVCEAKADGCRDWSSITACAASEICDSGACRKNCTDHCAAGAKACDGAGFKVCETKPSGCRDFSPVTACGTGEICDAGSCRKNCTDLCAAGTKTCDGGGFKVCETKPSGCRDWSSVTSCAKSEICDGGTCRKGCADRCTAGSKLCDAAGVRACAPAASGCLDFGSATACPAGQVCSGGDCADTCTDQCTAGDKVCHGNATLTCQKLASGCTEYVSPVACSAGETCSGGACSATPCKNQCAAGATRCTSGLVQTCRAQPSGCTEWSLPSRCPTGQVCPATGSACVVATCKAGESRCAGTKVETCDTQGSYFVSQVCPQSCSAGKCTATAQCTAGAVRCNGSHVEICNSSGTAWLYNQTCNIGCAGGVCTDPCTAGEKRCNGNVPETCNAQGTGWTAAVSCATRCFRGACIDADLVVDGITKTLEGELVYLNGVVLKNGGQVKVGASGRLTLRAKTITVDATSSIVATGTGSDTRGAGQAACCSAYYSSNCGCGCSRTTCSTGPSGSSYGNQGGTLKQHVGGCTSWDGCDATANAGATYDSDTDLSISQGSKSGSSLGGGQVSLYAESVDIAGQVTSNGTGSASGGGILIAADKLTASGAIQAAGGGGAPSAGGEGRVKLLRGSTLSQSGSVTGRKSVSVMPPLQIVSGSHPDSSRWYNDGLGELYLAWEKPFPTLNGYYWLFDGSPANVPSPSKGTFLQAESMVVPASKLVQGSNHFHVVSVDSAFTVGTVEHTFRTQLNTQPPAISSTSHGNPRTWYANNAIYLTWKNPQDDRNFTGYHYVFDHFADTVPSKAAGTFTTNPQILLSNVADGLWVFHLVNRDTRGATTKSAAHFIVYVGKEPQKGNLSGSVFDGSSANAPLGGVDIQINRGLFAVHASSNGTYTFSNNLYEGTWEVTASKSGYQAQTKTVTVVAGQVVNQNFTLTK